MESFLRVKKKSKYRPQIKPLNGGPDPKLSLKLGSASNKLERGLGRVLGFREGERASGSDR